MLALLTVTIFLGSFLLFLVQPMAAKELLPRLGGSPSVWTASMLFFQAALLAGYAWAHAVATRARFGPWLHVALLCLACAALPVGLRDGTPGASPTPWLLAALTLGYGMPFFALSAGAPALQRWFSRSSHPRAADPYFLYVASNAGSLVALLAYPLFVEPIIPLARQRTLWSIAFAAFTALVLACAWAVRARGPSRAAGITGVPSSHPSTPSAPTANHAVPAPTTRDRLLWLLLAAIPSSLTLGVTQHLSTDVAAAPLLWVIPLSIYLLSFMIAFGSRPLLNTFNLARLAPLVIVTLVLASLVRGFRLPTSALTAIHLLTLALLATLCHSLLARRRPDPARLTEFYLYLALGGVLGGAFNALLAPTLFNGVYEYPIAVVAAAAMRCLILGERAPTPRARTTALILDTAIALAIASLIPILYRATARLGIDDGSIRIGLACGLPVLLLYLTQTRPARFALSAGALLLGAYLLPDSSGRTLFRTRTFFGVYRVSATYDAITLTHGTTIHGRQFTAPDRRHIPLTYYHPDGPIGALWKALGPERTLRVAAVGLGTGALAAYTQPGQTMTFFEIDPAVVRIARSPTLFTYLADAKGDIPIVLGDARRSLEAVPPGSFDLLVLDAFSSDSIPMHLLTREAVSLYRRALAPGGVLMIHASNQFLDLEPIIGRLTADAGLQGWIRFDTPDALLSAQTGRFQSQWVVIGTAATIPTALQSQGWLALKPAPDTPLWTDDSSSIVPIIQWR
ncbi:MAG: fused MFS/spermidine synthase [Phycisphaerales bacterium]